MNTQPPTAPSSPPTRRAIPGPVLAFLYLAITGGLVATAVAAGGMQHPRLASALAHTTGIAAFAMLCMQFLTSGRFEFVSGRIGLDRTMGFHRQAAFGTLLMTAAHIAILAWPRGRDPDLAGAFQRLGRMLGDEWLLSGVASAATMLALTLIGAFARGRWVGYTGWRIGHGTMAVAAAGLAVHHVWLNGRLMSAPASAVAGSLLVGLAGVAFLNVYVVRPFTAHASGFRVKSARDLSPTVSELVVVPSSSVPFRFAAGQFVWLTIGRRHTVTDNPFSIASAPSDLPDLRFLIRKAGDMSNSVSRLAPGTEIGVDGPHGSFTLAEAGPGPILLLAGGIGIAPILSLLRELAATGDTRPLRLLATARTPEDHVVCSEIDALMRDRDFRSIHLVDTAADAERFVAGTCRSDHVRALIDGLDANAVTAFVCAPPAMMERAVPALTDAGIPVSRIVMERFDFDAGSDAHCRRIRRRMQAILLALFAVVFTIAGLATA